MPPFAYRQELDCNWPEVHRENKRVLEHNPSSPTARLRTAISELMPVGRLNEAVEGLKSYIGHWMRGMICLAKGPLEESVARFRDAAALSGNLPLLRGWRGMGLAKAGETAEAGALLDKLTEISRAAYVPPTCFAWTHLGFGYIDEAFTWIDRAVEGRDPIVVPIKSCPFLDPLRADPRFRALPRKMNLEE